MNTYFRYNLLAIYALAACSTLVTLPWDSGPLLQRLTVIILAIHLVETLVAFKHVKAFAGPLWKSIALSMLFGLLHWLPLARANAQTQK